MLIKKQVLDKDSAI